jgi:Undecaprenyl-phosphate glucose phosphotransferase
MKLLKDMDSLAGLAAPAVTAGHHPGTAPSEMTAGGGTSPGYDKGSRRGEVPYVSPEIVKRLLKMADFAALTTAALGLLLGSVGEGRYELVLAGFLALVLSFATLLSWRQMRLYEISALVRPAGSVLRAVLLAVVIGGAVAAFARYVLPQAGWQWLAGWTLISGGYLLISRVALALWAVPRERAGAFRRRIAIVGGGAAAEQAIDTLEKSPDLDVEIVGLFDDRHDERSPEHIRRYRKLGRIADLNDYARRHRVDLVIVAIPLSAEQRLLQILKRLWELPVDIRISGQASRLKLSPRAYDWLGDLPLLAVFDLPLGAWGWFVKGIFDRVVAALLIVLLSPVMAAVALAIRLESPGPVIFRQKRYGFNNELIEVWKFRSMYVDRCDADASRLVTKDDPRVTRVGRFIRKTSLDELPQLFNVLKGDLSLVGPRPHATQAKAADALYQEVVDGYFARHKVKPGITGWAQINGWRGETDTYEKIEKRVQYDLEYIENWSLWFDIYILLMTPVALLSSRNAENAY